MPLPIRTFPLIALLALGLLLPAAVTAQERTIAVTGSATQEVPNDTASLRFSVTKERKSRAASLRIVSIRLREVLAAVQSFPGVGPGDVSTGEISIRKVFRGKRNIFRASEGVTVILHQPAPRSGRRSASKKAAKSSRANH